MVYICGKTGAYCSFSKANGQCKMKSCIMQEDTDDSVDEVDLFDMLDEEEE